MFGTFIQTMQSSHAPPPTMCPFPPLGWLVVGRAVHRLSLQSSPPLWPAGHTAPKDREEQGEDTSSHDALACRKLDGVSGQQVEYSP